MPATVVRLRRRNGVEVTSCDIYIGRSQYQGGWRLPGSKWANPFRLSADTPAGRARVLAAYEAHVRASPELMGALPELRDKHLGCFCAPKPCHGDVLVKLLSELDAPRSARSAAPVMPDDDPLWAALGL